jgi:thiol-disulfide isomerase/thioredoxin
MNKVKLSDFFGKPIIVNFWASWCGPCVSELPEFDAMYAKYKDDVVFLMVNLAGGASENVDDVKAFAAENGYTFPLYFDIDSDGANTYGIWSIPQTLVIRADGSLLDTRIGAMSGETLENYIRQITEKGAN